MSHIKVLSQKPVFQTKHFTVNESKIAANNKEDTFHHIVFKESVYVIPLTPQREIYLIKQYRYVYDKEYLEIVAGIVEQGEDILNAAKRELKEEAGLEAGNWKSLGVIEAASNFFKIYKHYFVATELIQGEQTLDFSEDIQVIKMPIEQAVEKILSGEINAEKTITGVLLVYTLLQRGKL